MEFVQQQHNSMIAVKQSLMSGKRPPLWVLEHHGTLFRYARAFLDLLKDVPPFFHCPPEHVNLTGRPKSFLNYPEAFLAY